MGAPGTHSLLPWSNFFSCTFRGKIGQINGVSTLSGKSSIRHCDLIVEQRNSLYSLVFILCSVTFHTSLHFRNFLFTVALSIIVIILYKINHVVFSRICKHGLTTGSSRSRISQTDYLWLFRTIKIIKLKNVAFRASSWIC